MSSVGKPLQLSNPARRTGDSIPIPQSAQTAKLVDRFFPLFFASFAFFCSSSSTHGRHLRLSARPDPRCPSNPWSNSPARSSWRRSLVPPPHLSAPLCPLRFKSHLFLPLRTPRGAEERKRVRTVRQDEQDRQDPSAHPVHPIHPVRRPAPGVRRFSIRVNPRNPWVPSSKPT